MGERTMGSKIQAVTKARAKSALGRALVWPALGVSLTVLSGCPQYDEGKCNEAVSVTRQSITSKDFNLARQWRERAYTYCKDVSLRSTLDGEITAAEKAQLDEQAKLDARKKTADALTSLVKGLALEGKEDGARIARSATCPDPKEKKEGWCEATRSVTGGEPIKVRYWNKETKALLISGKTAGPASCDALGASTVVRTFGSTIDGTVAEFKHCTLSELGMQALVGSSAELSLVQVFSSEYLAKDASLAKRVRGN